MHTVKRLLNMLIITALLALTAIGCGSSDDDSNTDNANLPEAESLLQDSVNQITAAESIEVEMDVSGYPVPVKFDGLTLPSETPLHFKYARGIFQAPDRMNASIQFSLGNFSTTADLIALDRDHYFRGDLLTANRWINDELIQGFSPAALLSQEMGIPFALASITGLQMLGRTRMQGIDMFHLSGTIQANAVHSLTFGLMRSKDGELKIEVYISANDYRVAQIMLTEPPPTTDAQDETTTWEISILNYNQAVNITAPSMNNGD